MKKTTINTEKEENKRQFATIIKEITDDLRERFREQALKDGLTKEEFEEKNKERAYDFVVCSFIKSAIKEGLPTEKIIEVITDFDKMPFYPSSPNTKEEIEQATYSRIEMFVAFVDSEPELKSKLNQTEKHRSSKIFKFNT